MNLLKALSIVGFVMLESLVLRADAPKAPEAFFNRHTDPYLRFTADLANPIWQRAENSAGDFDHDRYAMMILPARGRELREDLKDFILFGASLPAGSKRATLIAPLYRAVLTPTFTDKERILGKDIEHANKDQLLKYYSIFKNLPMPTVEIEIEYTKVAQQEVVGK